MSLSISIKKLMLPILVVLSVEGCYLPPPCLKRNVVGDSFVCEAQVDSNRESVRLITEEEALLVAHLENFPNTDNKRIEVVELTNNQFKFLVFFNGKFLEMSLIIPKGEELFMYEPQGTVFNTKTKEEILKFDPQWEIPWEMRPNTEAVSGRLIGLSSLLPVTTYRSYEYLPLYYEQSELEIVVRLPVFKTKGNEIIKFDDITFKVSTFLVTEWRFCDW